MKNSTIKDVAKMANVSIATVSLVIHDHKRISPETKQKVQQAIEKLNYRPSRSARGLVSRKTGNVGFILTNDHFLRTEPFYTQIFMGTEFEARDHELYVLLATVDSDIKENTSLPRFILDKNIDGIIVAGKVPNLLIEKLKKFDLPIVFVDYLPHDKKSSVIAIDNEQGGILATTHLIELGHTHIGFIGGDIGHPSINDRFNGYKKALVNANIPFIQKYTETEEDYPARANGYNAARKLFSDHKIITAVFACNDAMAIGAMQYLKDSGKLIPDDVSIIGFDDVVPEGMINPALCTVSVPKLEMGVEAMKLISEQIKNPDFKNQKIFVPVELIVRQSTRKI
ncbi:MAG: LacI family DNA-binding transcriptional regulator [Ignavibacteriaceae bacterium]